MTNAAASSSSDFIRIAVAEDLQAGRYDRVQTRFPPEPNGYLHIGHAKALTVDFGMARDFGGKCNLRFDDTNPAKEETEYVDAIKEDIRWLGFDWEEREFYASDYFEELYAFAERLIQKGKAYIDDLSADQIREYRGTLTEPGKDSPFRNRTIAENLDLFRRMRAGEYPDGACVLRAKIDMASANMNMRDPVMYRILHAAHHRTDTRWCIYPMYDFAHGQSDSIEGITHSLCSLEYENHRPLYNWFLDALEIYHPRQIEFARLNLTYTMLSKRYLLRLVREGFVRGWDDPRMPTLCGMRRRGYPASAIHAFLEKVGVAKSDSTADMALLEHCVRDELNHASPRVMGVLKPLRLVVENYPEDKVEWFEAINNPEDASAGTRKVPFAKVLFIEQEDFMDPAPPKFFRLTPGREVRLRYAYIIQCTGSTLDPNTGQVVEVRCTYDPATRGGDAPDSRKIKSTIHWVSSQHAVRAEIRLYDRLFAVEEPTKIPEGQDFISNLTPQSLTVVSDAMLEPSMENAARGKTYQFERQGYFCVDPETEKGKLILNRTVTLRDEWAKIERSQTSK
jgi:glutaminyl-tRNA synthetase